ncbi:MAG: hypothetical protein K2G30_04725, partial [Muribaculaceae bacterium]|nr:hypothetical protein [Muribaculaceae bacterium]
MKLAKLIGGTALGGILVASVAYAAVGTSLSNAPKAAAGSVIASWAMGPGTVAEIVPVINAEGVTASFSHGSMVTGLRANQTLNSTSATATGTSFNLIAPLDAGKQDEAYVQYTLTPEDGYALTVTNVAFNISSMNSGDSRFEAYIVTPQGGETRVSGEAVYPGRSDKDFGSSFAQSFDVTGVEGVEGPVSLKIYLFSRNNQTSVRHLALSDVRISGKVAAPEVPDVPDPEVEPSEPVEVPADWKGEVAPGQFFFNVKGYTLIYTGTRW